MTATPDTVTVHLLADHAYLIPAVGELRWREWGRPPEPEALEWWVEVTAREAGRDRLPVTWVAIDAIGDALGAVGIGEFDIEERQDRSPWVMGMVVRADRRGEGIGRLLLSRLEGWAAAEGYGEVWVATGLAAEFYRVCGWRVTELVERAAGETATVMTKWVAHGG